MAGHSAVDAAIAQFEVTEGLLKTLVRKSYNGAYGGQYQANSLIQTSLISEMVRAHVAYTKLKGLGAEDRVVTPEKQQLFRTVVGIRHVPNAFSMGQDGTVRSFCDECDCKLVPGPKWYHKPGTHSDLCRSHFDKLPNEKTQEEYIVVENADSLGLGKDNYHVDQGKLIKARELLEIFGVDLKMGEAREMVRDHGMPQAVHRHTVHTWGLGATCRTEGTTPPAGGGVLAQRGVLAQVDYLTDVVAYYYHAPDADGNFLSYWKLQRFDSKGDPVEGPLADLPVESEANPIFADVYPQILATVRAAEAWIASGEAQAQEYELRETVQLASDRRWLTRVQCGYPDKARAFHVDESGQATEFNPGSPRSILTVNYEKAEPGEDPPTRAYLRELEPVVS